VKRRYRALAAQCQEIMGDSRLAAPISWAKSDSGIPNARKLRVSNTQERIAEPKVLCYFADYFLGSQR